MRIRKPFTAPRLTPEADLATLTLGGNVISGQLTY